MRVEMQGNEIVGFYRGINSGLLRFGSRTPRGVMFDVRFSDGREIEKFMMADEETGEYEYLDNAGNRHRQITSGGLRIDPIIRPTALAEVAKLKPDNPFVVWLQTRAAQKYPEQWNRLTPEPPKAETWRDRAPLL